MSSHHNISRLQYITQDVEGSSHLLQVEQACSSGIRWVQLRVKSTSIQKAYKTASEAKVICDKHNTKLIINDHVEIAKSIKAHGVHLGKLDMDPAKARNILGPSAIIGGTANNINDIESLINKGVNYIGLGPYKNTKTKENLSPILGISGYQNIMEKLRKFNNAPPIIAIGGIKLKDIQPLMSTKIHGIAVASLINLAKEKKETIKLLLVEKSLQYN